MYLDFSCPNNVPSTCGSRMLEAALVCLAAVMGTPMGDYSAKEMALQSRLTETKSAFLD